MDQNTVNAIPVTVFHEYTGFLADDAQLIDRKCSNDQCRRMFSGVYTCPKCGSAPVALVTKTGSKLCYSESTFFPYLGPKTVEEYKKHISGRKGAMYPTFRFRLVNFSDKSGNLHLPALHPNLLKGCKVHLAVKNHLPILVPFAKDDGTTGVELMYHIFPSYKDICEILAPPKEKTGLVPAPLPITNPSPAVPAINNLAQTVAQIIIATGVKEVTPEKVGEIMGLLSAGGMIPPQMTTEVKTAVSASNFDGGGFYPEGFDPSELLEV
jgi:hypothetical protein